MRQSFAIGIDIGATHTKIGLVNAAGLILDYRTIPSRLKTGDPDPFLRDTFEAVQPLCQGREIVGIGLALCSLINESHTGALLSVNAPDLNHLDIRSAFASRFQLPVQVVNDVAAYAIAEADLGGGRDVDRLLCLGLGTGLAIAVILNGQLLETWGGIPADAGRIILDPDSPFRCNGGVRGSAEALCGVAQIERLAREHYGRAGISAQEVIAASRRGDDPLAARIMADIGDHVGHLLAILSPVYFPQKILITGGIAEAGEPLFQAARNRFDLLIGDYMTGLALLATGQPRPIEICKGTLGPDAAVIGAAFPFFAPRDGNPEEEAGGELPVTNA